MKKGKGLAALAFAISLAAPAYAGEEEHQLSYNAAVVSDYRFRGISQTRLDPALQGGADYTHAPTGWYAGTWLSTIKWTRDAGGNGNLEWDLYGGKRGELGQGISYDVGALYYYYPDNKLEPSANTFELYGQLGYGPATIRYWHTTTNWFGARDSKHSGYLDANANVDLPYGMVLNLHAGHQRVKNNGALSYTDYKLGLTKDFGVATVSLAYVRANTAAYASPGGQNLGRAAALATVSRTF